MNTIDSYLKSIAFLHYGNQCGRYMSAIQQSILNQIEHQDTETYTIDEKNLAGRIAMISAHEGKFNDNNTRDSKALYYMMDIDGNDYLLMSHIHSSCSKVNGKYDLDKEEILSQTFSFITIADYSKINNEFQMEYF